MWVFWVHASNAARFEQSYRDIADRVKIAGRRDVQANIFKLVHDWLCDSRQRWLLVLDNVNDARFLLDVQASGQGQHSDDSRTASRPLHKYLPQCERCSILVTSRNKDAVLELVVEQDVVVVEPMDKIQALALLRRSCKYRKISVMFPGLPRRLSTCRSLLCRLLLTSREKRVDAQ
jgi:hypothetical protein